MELTFSHNGLTGRVTVTVVETTEPDVLGAYPGAKGLATCTAVITLPEAGYRSLLGWVQLVRSTDNTSGGAEFEMDPFDPFDLYATAPTPYCWYGITPTLFDAPSRDTREPLQWLAHSFLATSPIRDDGRRVTPLLGFSWGFDIDEHGAVAVRSAAALTDDDWNGHLAYLTASYPGWEFTPAGF